MQHVGTFLPRISFANNQKPNSFPSVRHFFQQQQKSPNQARKIFNRGHSADTANDESIFRKESFRQVAKKCCANAFAITRMKTETVNPIVDLVNSIWCGSHGIDEPAFQIFADRN